MQGESTDEIVLKVARRVDRKDIDRSHGIKRRPTTVSSSTSASVFDEGTKQGNRKKTKKCIIVKLCSYRIRQQLLVNRRKLKSSGISIHEDLTASVNIH